MKTIIAIIISFISINLFGCECIEFEFSDKHVKRFYKWSDKAFIGNLIDYNDGVYKLEVIQNFKGTHFRDTLWGKVNSSCSIAPKEKGLWIVYASNIDSLNNEIDIDACSSTRNLNSNRQYLLDSKLIETDSYKSKKEIAENLLEISILNELKNLNKQEPSEERSTINWVNVLAIVLSIIAILMNLQTRIKSGK